MFKCVGVLLAAFGPLTMFAQTEVKRAWKVEDSFRLKTISDLQMHPNSRDLLFVLSSKDLQKNRSYSSVWIWNEHTKKARPLTDTLKSATSPRFSPDGKKIAFFTSDSEGLGVWVMDIEGNNKHKLAPVSFSNAYISGGGNRLAWSPDGMSLAYSSAGERYYPNDIKAPYLPTGDEVMVIDRLLHKAPYYYSDLRRMHIWTISLDGGAPVQVSKGDFDYHSISWSPDGKYIACVSNQTGNDDFNANNDVYLLPVNGGYDKKQMTATIGPEYRVVYSPDGSSMAYHGRIRSNRSKESDAEFMKVYVMSSGKPFEAIELTAGVDRWCNNFQWAPDGKSIYFVVQDGGAQDLYRVSSDGKNLSALITGHQGQVGAIAPTTTGKVYYVYEEFDKPSEIFVYDPKDGSKRQLTSFNEAFVKEVQIMDATHFTYVTQDEYKINAWVIKPYGYQEGKKYPMILDIHGGPHSQYGYKINDRLQEFAANGYAVLIINPRGSTDQGQAFSDAVVGDLVGGDYRDIMTGVHHATGRFPFIDSENMGLTGISYGGYLTNWIITQTNLFKAAVPISGLSNLISAWSEGCNSDWFESDMGFMPFEDFERAWEVSPLKYIHGCATPTLFVNGRWDFITTLNQADAMFVVLKKRGVPTRILLYPEEGHGIRLQPKHGADYRNRSIDWFDTYLKN